MSFVSRFATAAVQRQITRLQLDYNRQAEKLQTALHQRDDAVERNHGHIRAAHNTADGVAALVEAYNKLEQALETACGERDQAKAELLEAGSQHEREVQDLAKEAMRFKREAATATTNHERARVEHEDLERELRRLRQHSDLCPSYQAVEADDKATRLADL